MGHIVLLLLAIILGFFVLTVVLPSVGFILLIAFSAILGSF